MLRFAQKYRVRETLYLLTTVSLSLCPRYETSEYMLIANCLSWGILHLSLKMLSHIRRDVARFDNPRALKVLYTALVRSQLEYAFVIWSPHQRAFVDLFERVQHKFLDSAAFRLSSPMQLWDHDYARIMNVLKSLTGNEKNNS